MRRFVADGRAGSNSHRSPTWRCTLGNSRRDVALLLVCTSPTVGRSFTLLFRACQGGLYRGGCIVDTSFALRDRLTARHPRTSQQTQHGHKVLSFGAELMSAMRILWRSGCALVFAGILFSALYAQRPFREYPSVESGEYIPGPPDWQHQGEWAFARLMYPPGPF